MREARAYSVENMAINRKLRIVILGDKGVGKTGMIIQSFSASMVLYNESLLESKLGFNQTHLIILIANDSCSDERLLKRI